jgi:hypothetical protein
VALLSADFAKALKGRMEVFVGIAGVSRSMPHAGGASSEERIESPEVRDGFLTGISGDRGDPGNPLRLMIPLERVAYLAFWERPAPEEAAGPMKRVTLERARVKGASADR